MRIFGQHVIQCCNDFADRIGIDAAYTEAISFDTVPFGQPLADLFIEPFSFSEATTNR